MHANARLTPLMRAEMITQFISQNLSRRAVATAFHVSDRTLRRWLQRAIQADFPSRLHDRSCVPRRQPRKTNSRLLTRILRLRRQRRSYAQILTVLRVSKATISRVLRRHGLHRLSALDPKPPVRRYERARPGDLLHLDIKKLGRFSRPGVRSTGDRTVRNRGAGLEFLHVAIDDHSRLAFACLLPDERIQSVVLALQQALQFYSAHGVKVRSLLTDRGSSYRSKDFACACHSFNLAHLFTRPYRPQTNGKAERFIQTLTREWAYARPYRSSNHRASYLPHFLFDYNYQRPHSALHSLPPVSRLVTSADNLLTINS
ncbi:MAG TPA: IS481 family transposase [Chthoniobacteraceae bacterium]|nr:IS481 family transposase [Chthoniobacteraceae bacterium]